MAKLDPRVQELDIDVLTAAKERIRRAYLIHDTVVVSFSGGKDSLVVINLCRQVLDEMGQTSRPVDFHFRDEEFIQQEVINHVLKYMEKPGFRGVYFAFPMKSAMMVMGDHRPYVMWDPAREGRWVRQPPECAIRQLHPENKPLRQTEVNPLTIMKLGLRGRVCILNGIRAGESIQRYRSCLAIKNKDNWLCGDPTGFKNITFAKPIYDWSERDVFKFFMDFNIDYCPIYDKEMWTNQPLRVSSAIHEKNYDTLSKLRMTHPDFYERVLDIFPDIEVHERYWKDFDQLHAIADYPKSFGGIVDYIHATLTDPKAKRAALKAVKTAQEAKNANRRVGRYSDEANGGCFGYPLLYVWRKVVSGTYHDGIQPYPYPTPSEIGYERAAEEENTPLGILT